MRTEVLIETMIDALFAYDGAHRLLPDTPLPPGGERLIGSSIRLEGIKRERDELPRFADPKEDLPVKLEQSDPERHEIIVLSQGITDHIHHLRQQQAKLWKEHENLLKVSFTGAPKAVSSARKKAQRQIAKVRAEASRPCDLGEA